MGKVICPYVTVPRCNIAPKRREKSLGKAPKDIGHVNVVSVDVIT